MSRWTSPDGLTIHYIVEGDPGAPTVILQHGFASSGEGNWRRSGIAAQLVQAGFRIVLMDARGHGLSDKPHDPAFYGEAKMALDLMGVAGALDLNRYHLVGYSMGAVVALLVAVQDPRVTRLAVGGIGEGVLDRGGLDRSVLSNLALADGLLAEDTTGLSPMVAGFRRFVEANKGDRHALAAHAKVVHSDPIALNRIVAQTLVFAGADDPLASNPHRLADAIPTSRLKVLAGDHLGVFNEPALPGEIVTFLQQG